MVLVIAPSGAYTPRQAGAALLCAVAGVMLITSLMGINGFMPYWDTRFAEYDHHAYLAVARDGVGAPGRASAPPYCWRILTPLIARQLPTDLPASFFIVSFGSLVLSALFVYVLCRNVGLDHDWSLVGEVSFLSYFWAVGFNLWDYIMVDAMSILIVIAGLVILENRRGDSGRSRAVLAALMVLGALNKETYIALAGACFVCWVRRQQGPWPVRAARAVLPILPALAVTLLLRSWIAPDPSQMKEFVSYSVPSVFKTMVSVRMRDLPRWLIEAFVDPWGPLVLAPVLLSPIAAAAWFRSHPHRLALLAIAVAQTLVATSVGRLVIVAAPALVLFSIEKLRARLAGARPWGGLVLLLLLLQFLFQYLRRTTLGQSLPPYESIPLVKAAYVARALAFAASLLVWSRWGRGAMGQARPGSQAASAV